MLLGKKEVQVFVDELGDYSDCYYAVNKLLITENSQKYCGLEDLADEDILAEIIKFL